MAASDRSSAADAPERLTQAAQGWWRDGVRLLRVRLELLGVEAREHAYTTIELLLAGLAAIVCLGLGLGFLAALLTVMLWEGHRVLALAVFTTFFLMLGGLAAGLALSRWRRTQRWFEASADELRADEDRLAP
jgi:uncharacterized membrane protein YqjE